MERKIQIPQGITAEKKGALLEVKGPKGSLQREFKHPAIDWVLEGNAVMLICKSKQKKSLSLLGTYASHIQNMCIGVQKGYQAILKVIYSHFPMKIGMEGSKLVIQNFMGERSSRTVDILSSVKVDVKKDEVIVSGISKEDVGQTAGRIEGAAKVIGFDKRVFMDGIHLVSKTRPVG